MIGDSMLREMNYIRIKILVPYHTVLFLLFKHENLLVLPPQCSDFNTLCPQDTYNVSDFTFHKLSKTLCSSK